MPDGHGMEWFAWRLRHVRHGVIRITAPSYSSQAVDAVAVLR